MVAAGIFKRFFILLPPPIYLPVYRQYRKMVVAVVAVIKNFGKRNLRELDLEKGLFKNEKDQRTKMQ